MQLSKARQKYIRSLHQKKYRQKYNKFLAEGDKIVEELLAQGRFRTELLVALPGWLAGRSLPAGLPAAAVTEVDAGTLGRLSCLTTPNRVLAVVEPPPEAPPWDDLARGYALYLDGIRDPGNLGTLLRIADWFGFSWVFGSEDTVERFNPKVVQASMGAVLRVGYAVMPFDAIADARPDWPRLGASLDGEDLFSADLPGRGLLVVGNESRGLSPPVLARVQRRLAIPRGPGGGAESLNAAVATGIFCAWLRHARPL